MSVTGYRFQVGDVEEIAEEMNRAGGSQVEIASESELEQVCEDLEEYGIVLDSTLAFAYDALDTEDNPDFYARAFFSGDQYIDFFLTEDETGEGNVNIDELYLD